MSYDLELAQSLGDTLKKRDAVIVVTEHNQFKEIDFSKAGVKIVLNMENLFK